MAHVLHVDPHAHRRVLMRIGTPKYDMRFEGNRLYRGSREDRRGDIG